jgi:hypothetical protein
MQMVIRKLCKHNAFAVARAISDQTQHAITVKSKTQMLWHCVHNHFTRTITSTSLRRMRERANTHTKDCDKSGNDLSHAPYSSNNNNNNKKKTRETPDTI